MLQEIKMTPYEISMLITSIGLVMFTSALAIFTYRMYSEVKKTREFQIKLNKPELSIIFEPSKRFVQWINIQIKNIGKSPLYNLELEKVEGDFVCFNGKKISELEYLKKINYLRPEQEIVQFFYNFVNSNLKPEEIRFDLLFKYHDKDKKIYRKKFSFDFGQFRDMSSGDDEPFYKIAKNIESMQKDIHHLSTGFYKLSVITQTKKEKIEEDKKWLKQIKQRQKNEK
jgi:hypothetical protein